MMPDPRPSEVRFVVDHLRALSREEAYMTMPEEDPEALTRILTLPGNVSWVAYHEGMPAAVLGARPMHPGVWGIYALGTDHYAKVLGQVARQARRVLIPMLRATGAHRGQTLSPASHTKTHGWLKMLGGTEEATLRGYGRNGEAMKLFAWYEEDADGHGRRRT